MGMTTAAKSPGEYLQLVHGWPRECLYSLRAEICLAASMEETLKWGGLVYMSGGPAIFVRADSDSVRFGFWRGQRMMEIEPRLQPGGKYEMATILLRRGDSIEPAVVRKLVMRAVELNRKFGNPWDDAKPARTKAPRKRVSKKVAPKSVLRKPKKVTKTRARSNRAK